MASVELLVAGWDAPLPCATLAGSDRLGEPASFTVTLTTPAPIEPAELLGKGCAIAIGTRAGERLVPGVVARFAAIATSQTTPARRYRLAVTSTLHLLALRRRTKVFQHLSVPEIIKAVLTETFYAADDVVLSLQRSHPPREYCVQYAETDASFVRRLCEEEGLYFRFEERSGREAFILEDTSSSAPDGVTDPILLIDTPDLHGDGLAAFACRAALRRRPGKVTLRDYNYNSPSLVLEGVAEAGAPIEKETEVYEAPGRFADPSAGKDRARLRLESLRAQGDTISFQTSALQLAPGLAFTIEPGDGYSGTARPQGKHLVVALNHRCTAGSPYALVVEAIPIGVPFRLRRDTPRPRINGLHTAFITGPAGQEIHTDRKGRVHVHFPWDREGPTDDKSSLPVRLMQPNTPGSMVIPRIGWEVLVMFEDGDPDRPYVIGRTYNAKQPPPESLPVNKTVTSLRTWSSPGPGGQNSIQFDDAAGRQHVVVAAAFAKNVTVANNMVTQVANNEGLLIKGSQSRTVGATEDVSVTEAYTTSVGSQSATVGGLQKLYVQGDQSVDVGSETVLVGGALLEKVGDPVTGLKNLAVSTALAGAGEAGAAGGLFGKAMTGLSIAGGVGWGAVHGGAAGAGLSAGGMLAGMVPGGDALFAAVTGAGGPAPWHEDQGPAGPQAGGGGAGGASNTAGPAGPGPGHRNTKVGGAMMELIGAVNAIATPGPIGWTTVGASTFVIGGSHSTRTVSCDLKVLGASTEALGSLKIVTRQHIARAIRGALTTQIVGSLTSNAKGGDHVITAGPAITMTIGGTLTLVGGNVTFICGDSTWVSASDSGVVVKAGKITITGASTQSAQSTHK